MNNDYRKGFEDGIRCFAWWKDGKQMVGTCGTTLDRALAGVENRYGFQPPIGESKTPMKVAISECEGMAAIIDVFAGRATEQDHKNGQYGNWCHDSEVLMFAAHLLRRYTESKKSPSWSSACGDCDPCLGGRPDQCAVMAEGSQQKSGSDIDHYLDRHPTAEFQGD